MERCEFIRRLFDRTRELDPDARCEVAWSASSDFEAQQVQGERVDYSVADSGGLGFRVLTKGHMGYASTQILDEEAVELLACGAVENAALVESEDRQFIYSGSMSYPKLNTWNPALEEVTAARKLEMVASQLEVDPDVRLAEIADLFGFYDEFHLSRSFKQKYGLSPSQYKSALARRERWTVPR